MSLGRVLVVGYTGYGRFYRDHKRYDNFRETGKELLKAFSNSELQHATLCGRREIDLPESLKAKATQTKIDFENVPTVSVLLLMS